MKYRPTNVLPADWNRVAGFARDAVMAYGPGNAHIATQMLSTVTHYVLWATLEEYAPLNNEEIFHPSLMGRYLRMRTTTKDSSAYVSLYSRLFRVANAVSDVEHNRKKRGKVVHPMEPYTAAELAELESWADTRHNTTHRRYAKTFLALAGGAGLLAVDCLNVRGADILRSDDGYSIRVAGNNPRTVPVTSSWAHLLDEVIDSIHDDDFAIFPTGPTAKARLRSIKWLTAGGHPAPYAQRLRDTWFLHQLQVLPLGVLLHAAGMPDITTLRRYLPGVHHDDYPLWEQVLRNPDAASLSATLTGGDIR